jgi:hypothetical protein
MRKGTVPKIRKEEASYYYYYFFLPAFADFFVLEAFFLAAIPTS